MQPGSMGVENHGIIVSMLHSAFPHTVSIACFPQGIKVSIAFGKPSNTTTVLPSENQAILLQYLNVAQEFKFNIDMVAQYIKTVA